MVSQVGVIGFSEENGHPFSFSAIINGYDDKAFAAAGWPVIHDYLKARGPEDFGFDGFTVTHAWTQDGALTQRLCSACLIGTACSTVEDMVDAVDAVIIARDDWESHLSLAMPFLEAGKPVFVDKPLTVDPGELAAFEPHLRAGRLMSTSGLRYARELDPLRNGEGSSVKSGTRLVTGTVINGLEKYGIHMIEAVAGLGGTFAEPISVSRLEADHESFAIRLSDGTLFQLNCLGAVDKTFHLSFFGETGHRHFDLHDNFTAFRRTLAAFFDMARTGNPAIDPAQTLRLLRLLMVARELEPNEIRDLA